MPLTMQFGAPLGAEATRFVSGSGNDASDGLTPITAKRTLSAAYADLPTPASDIAGVGTIYAAPGRYDVGAGLALVRGKPVKIIGTIPAPPYVTSNLTAPLSINCAIVYTSTGAASMITTIGGTASANMLGLHFENLLFEFSNAATTTGIDMNSCWYPTVNRCYFFADKTSGSPGPAAVAAQGFFLRDDTTYGGAGTDCSWGRFDDNKAINMALGTVGDAAGNNNHQLFTRNHGFGIAHTNTSALPFITVVNGNRCFVRDTNVEAYNVGIKFDSCWESGESGTGGEFVDVLLDLYNTKGCMFAPGGTSMYALGSATPIIATPLLVRGDSFTKANVFILSSTWTSGNTQRLWMPTDDGSAPSTSGLLAAGQNNVIISPRYSADEMRAGGTSTTTPGAVATVNIAHGLGTTPVKYTAQAANANARGAPAMYVSVDATNVILTFASNLTAATSYAWAWTADAR